MFTYRLCNESDKEYWIAMNREFMAEEIEDDDLWNNTNETSDEQFSHTFMEALESDDLISLMILKKTVGLWDLLI